MIARAAVPLAVVYPRENAQAVVFPLQRQGGVKQVASVFVRALNAETPLLRLAFAGGRVYVIALSKIENRNSGC